MTEDVGTLQKRYFASLVPAERQDILQWLGRLDPPQALPLLARIFDQEKRIELRQQVLEVAADFNTPESERAKWDLFAKAAATNQPFMIRLSALQTLAGFQDARVPALLEKYSRDANPTIREQAKRMLDEITETP